MTGKAISELDKVAQLNDEDLALVTQEAQDGTRSKSASLGQLKSLYLDKTYIQESQLDAKIKEVKQECVLTSSVDTDIIISSATHIPSSKLVAELSSSISSDLSGIFSQISAQIESLSDSLSNDIQLLSSDLSGDIEEISSRAFLHLANLDFRANTMSVDLSSLSTEVGTISASFAQDLTSLSSDLNETSSVLSLSVQSLSDSLSAEIRDLSNSLSIQLSGHNHDGVYEKIVNLHTAAYTLSTEYVLTSSVDVDVASRETSSVPSSKLFGELSDMLSTEISSTALSVQDIYDIIKITGYNKIIDHHQGTSHQFQLENFAINICEADDEHIGLVIKQLEAGYEDVSREFVVWLKNPNRFPVMLQFNKAKEGVDYQFFAADENTLGAIVGETSVAFLFQEIGQQQFFVRRFTLKSIEAESVQLFTVTCHFQDKDGIQLESDQVTEFVKDGYEWTIDTVAQRDGYSFLRWFSQHGELQVTYDVGQKVPIHSDMTFIAEFVLDKVNYIKFINDDSSIISSYTIMNNQIVQPIDPATGAPYTKIEYPDVRRATQYVAWSQPIPDYRYIEEDVIIYAVWIDKETEGQQIEDDDVVYKIDDNGRETLLDDEGLQEIMLLDVDQDASFNYDLAREFENDETFITLI